MTRFVHFTIVQRIEQRIRCEAELRQRIEQLEKRQTQDDAVLNVVNRYWNQLNEDIRVLLQRFDAETADEAENRSMSLIPSILIHTFHRFICSQMKMR